MIKEVEVEEYLDEDDDEIILFRDDAVRHSKLKDKARTFNCFRAVAI